MKEEMKNLLYILAGNTIYALAVTLFILPDGLITGGTTGLALFFYHQFGLPIQVFVSAFNVTMFVLGAIVLGKKFALTTIVSTFYYPFILSVFQNMPMIGKMTDSGSAFCRIDDRRRYRNRFAGRCVYWRYGHSPVGTE